MGNALGLLTATLDGSGSTLKVFTFLNQPAFSTRNFQLQAGGSATIIVFNNFAGSQMTMPFTAVISVSSAAVTVPVIVSGGQYVSMWDVDITFSASGLVSMRLQTTAAWMTIPAGNFAFIEIF